jgi:AcrR family transcriptional regulator
VKSSNESPDPAPSARDRIIEATIDILGESGEARLRLSAVAERAGLSTGAIYGAFTSRQALIATANVARIRRWTVEAVRASADGSTSDARQAERAQVAEASVRVTLSPEGREQRLAWAESAAHAMYDPRLADVLHATEREFLDYTASQIELRQAEGVIRRELDPRAVATIRMAIAIGVAVTSRAYDDDPEFTDRLVEAWPYLSGAFLAPGVTKNSF